MVKSKRSPRTRRSNRPTLVIYGTLAIPRMYCPACEHTALVIKGKMACCDRRVEADPQETHRESLPSWVRDKLTQEERDRVVADQGGLCIYCGLWFGSTVTRRGKESVLQVHMDHLVPFCWDGNNNVLAACQVCNGIKHDLIFRTLEEARAMIQIRRDELGYEP